MTTPAYPAGHAAGAGAPPKDVQTAFQLYIANVVIGVIGAILSFLTAGAYVDAALRRAGINPANLSPQQQSQVEAAARGGLVFGIVIALVLLALYVFFVFQMRAGKNWARIVLTVLTALAVLVTLIGFGGYAVLLAAGGLGVMQVIISVVQLILVIAAVVFMFRPAANVYFGAPR